MVPVLEMTFSDVAGDPWEGRAGGNWCGGELESERTLSLRAPAGKVMTKCALTP
jgi:hypothetical protein